MTNLSPGKDLRTGKVDPPLPTLHPDIRRARHPPPPHGCGLPSPPWLRRLQPLSTHRPRTHSLLRAILPHSPNPHFPRWTVPVNLPLAHPNAIPVHSLRRLYPDARVSSALVSYLPPFFSRVSASEQIASLPTSWDASPSSSPSCPQISSTSLVSSWVYFCWPFAQSSIGWVPRPSAAWAEIQRPLPLLCDAFNRLQ